MTGVNKVILIGNLGRDPEFLGTDNGHTLAKFSLATTGTSIDTKGERVERTEWHRVIAWGRTAELCAEHLAKGRTAYVEGRLQTREWEDREGNKRSTIEVVAKRVQFLGSPRGASGPSHVTDEPPI